MPVREADIAERLRAAAARRAPIAEARGADGEALHTAYRLVNGGGDGLPGVAIDVYGDFLVVSVPSDDPGAREPDGWSAARTETLLNALSILGRRGVYLKKRPKTAQKLTDELKRLLAPPEPVRGEAAPSPLLVRENGLPFHVLLGDGMQTGLFLDQRDNRQHLRTLAGGRSFLNLFAYTGAFTVAAVSGGASRSLTLDASRPAILRAEENLALLGRTGFGAEAPQATFAPSVQKRVAHVCADVDVLAWLPGAKKRGETFDLVVLDPPSFATTKTSRFSAKTDYGALAAEVMGLLAPGGTLFASMNLSAVPRAQFRRTLLSAATSAGREVWQVKDLPNPLDFPPEPGEEPPTKVVALTLGRALRSP